MRTRLRLKRKLGDATFRIRFLARNLQRRNRQVWLDDRGRAFSCYTDSIAGNEIALVFGNAPNLNVLTKDCVQRLNQVGAFRIGVNRAFKLVPCDVLLWTDSELWPELDPSQISEGTRVIRIARPHGHPPYIRWWIHHRRLDNWDRRGLFFLRNTLVSALHLCYLVGIRRIVLFGVSLESAAHFYSDPQPGESLPPYEHHERHFIDRVFLGYDIQRCVREVLEHLKEEGFDIRYVGESRFLSELGLTGYPDLSFLEADPEMESIIHKESNNVKTKRRGRNRLESQGIDGNRP